MAKNDKDKGPSNRGLINRLAINVRDGINSIYTRSYYNRPTNMADIKDIKDRLNTSINTITSTNMDIVGEPNISKLLSRANKSLNGDANLTKGIEDFFSDSASMDALLQTYISNKYLVDLDQEIDVVCKYMPKLLEALDCKKDNVLSADHFSMDYIYMENNTSIPDATFSERIKNIKDKYDVLNEVETWYMNASKYGEQFLYIVPYNRAIGKLLNNKPAFNFNNMAESTILSSISESTILGRVNENTYTTLYESGSIVKGSEAVINNAGINVEIDTSNMLTETVYNTYKAIVEKRKSKALSLCEQQMSIIEEAVKEAEENHRNGAPISNQSVKPSKQNITNAKHQYTIDAKELDITLDDGAQDGLIDLNRTSNSDGSEQDLNVPGCIIKKLKREMVKPIYTEDICIGYLYLEVKDSDKFEFSNSIFDRTTSNMFKDLNNGKDANRDDIVDKRLADLSTQVSKFIDSKFVNTNIDLAKEIYIMLKHNDMIHNPSHRFKVTFIPADDIVHIKFNEDPDTHRGISDLAKALFPAKIYCAMYLVNAIANMTRGYDRRVYYVKQTVDTNTAKSLLTTINQFKKSNFNIRQIENINNIIGISGSLHDYLIPTMGGDPPVQFEIMPGQKTDPPTEQLQALEEMAINSTDVPLELIQARQSMDYAVHYTMTNSKFLRKVYNRQASYSKFLSIIFTKIYNYEYGTNDKLQVKLPPPMFLNITNTNQVIQNTLDFANNVVTIYMADEPRDDVKMKFTTKVQKYYLGSYLDFDVLEKLKTESEQEVTIKHQEQQ